jgi:hypothetical protein
MRDMGVVTGDVSQAAPLLVGKTTVYVRTNIVIEQGEDGREIARYNEIQYTLPEYVQMMANRLAQLEAKADHN